jgi:hypothetical protein
VKSDKSDIYLTNRNIRPNGAHKNKNDNTTTPIFIGLKKTRTPQREGGAGKDKQL